MMLAQKNHEVASSLRCHRIGMTKPPFRQAPRIYNFVSFSKQCNRNGIHGLATHEKSRSFRTKEQSLFREFIRSMLIRVQPRIKGDCNPHHAQLRLGVAIISPQGIYYFLN